MISCFPFPARILSTISRFIHYSYSVLVYPLLSRCLTVTLNLAWIVNVAGACIVIKINNEPHAPGFLIKGETVNHIIGVALSKIHAAAILVSLFEM